MDTVHPIDFFRYCFTKVRSKSRMNDPSMPRTGKALVQCHFRSLSEVTCMSLRPMSCIGAWPAFDNILMWQRMYICHATGGLLRKPENCSFWPAAIDWAEPAGDSRQ